MNEYIGRNYVDGHRKDMFVGISKECGLKTRKCYIVRVPSVKGGGSSIRKCGSRGEAESVWRGWDGWDRFGGMESWMNDGEVPFRDLSYVRPSERKRRSGR